MMRGARGRRYIAIGVILYVLAVGYGVFYRDFTMKGAMFDLPIGLLLVAAVLFFIGYETLRYTLPFLTNTALFFMRKTLPCTTYARVEQWVHAKWSRTPEIMQRSIWMPRKKHD